MQKSIIAPAALLLPGLLLTANLCCRRVTTATAPQSVPATAPSTQPSTSQAKQIRYTQTYLDLIRQDYRQFPSTQPLDEPLDLPQAGHFTLSAPIYLSPLPRAEMWITRPDAPPIDDALRRAIDPATNVDAYIVRQKVLFVDWAPNSAGDWNPFVVCQKDAANADIFSPSGHTTLPLNFAYDWPHALPWSQLVLVPTPGGVSVLDFSGTLPEAHFEFALPPGSRQPTPMILPDLRGVLAWIPHRGDLPGSGQVCRYLDGRWTPLDPQTGWTGDVVHIVPLLDGSALQLLGESGGPVTLAVGVLEKTDIDEKAIDPLIEQLNDDDPDKRRVAYEELLRYGPGIWPILQQVGPSQPPEAVEAIHRLLREKIVPSLGGLQLVGSKKLTIADRLSDGGVIFFAEDGVDTSSDPDHSQIEAPAWISVRPGLPISLLPNAMVADLTPANSKIWAVGDEWIVRTPANGVEQFIGNSLIPVLREDESAFDELIGIDRQGRWLLRKSTESTGGPTLVIDRSLPDPRPRLPGWVLNVADRVGWDAKGWPVMQRGSTYALTQNQWHLLAPDERTYFDPGEMPATPPPQPSTAATTPAPSTVPSAPTGSLILQTADGTRYFNGNDALTAIDNRGHRFDWPLPAEATGDANPKMAQAPDGRLYLFNQAGRLLRLRPELGHEPPFELEATFAKDVPNVANITRLWIDPAGRLDLEAGKTLVVFFPAGYIPRAISQMMLGGSN